MFVCLKLVLVSIKGCLEEPYLIKREASHLVQVKHPFDIDSLECWHVQLKAIWTSWVSNVMWQATNTYFLVQMLWVADAGGVAGHTYPFSEHLVLSLFFSDLFSPIFYPLCLIVSGITAFVNAMPAICSFHWELVCLLLHYASRIMWTRIINSLWTMVNSKSLDIILFTQWSIHLG